MPLRFAAALAALFLLAGCSSPLFKEMGQRGEPYLETGSMQSTATTASRQSKPVVEELPPIVVAPSDTDFPSSKNHGPLTGKWKTMRLDGFTGGFADVCRLLGLGKESDYFCRKYRQQKEVGLCREMTIPNGIVFNRLTFTKGGRHTVQYNVPVELKNPVSRTAMLCYLGDGIYAGWALGCGNHFRIDANPPRFHSSPPKREAPQRPARERPEKPQVARYGCPKAPYHFGPMEIRRDDYKAIKFCVFDVVYDERAKMLDWSATSNRDEVGKQFRNKNNRDYFYNRGLLLPGERTMIVRVKQFTHDGRRPFYVGDQVVRVPPGRYAWYDFYVPIRHGEGILRLPEESIQDSNWYIAFGSTDTLTLLHNDPDGLEGYMTRPTGYDSWCSGSSGLYSEMWRRFVCKNDNKTRLGTAGM